MLECETEPSILHVVDESNEHVENATLVFVDIILIINVQNCCSFFFFDLWFIDVQIHRMDLMMRASWQTFQSFWY